jgi:hypothetical protein
VVLSDFQGPLVWRKKMEPEELTYSDPRIISNSYNFDKLLYYDFDNNGLLDIAVANDRHFIIYKNNLETNNEEIDFNLEISLKNVIIDNRIFFKGLNQSNLYSFEIIDVVGNIFQIGVISSDAIDVSGLNSGAYFIRITEEKSKASKTVPFIKN